MRTIFREILYKGVFSALGIFFTVALYAQQTTVTVRGTVSNDQHEVLDGASVRLKKTGDGAQTNARGEYTVTADIGDTLVFSFVGYKDQERPVTATTATVNVMLLTAAQSLSEIAIVNIGYGSLNRTEVSSAITHLSPDDLSSFSGNGALMSIQGKVAGLTVSNTAAADPNSSPSIQLRGVSSRSAGLGPLYIINGVPGGNIDNINQNDIESIDVLKGGAASAIYGTRGSNGVIVITTKKGSGTSRIFYEGYAALDYPADKVHVLNRDQFIKDDRGVDFGANTDWLKAVTHSPAFSQKHTLQFSGGDSKTNYFASADYRDASGIDLRSSKQEYGARVNINHVSENKLYEITFNAAPRYANTNLADYDGFNRSLTLNPTISPYDSDGNFAFINTGGFFPNNPVERATLIKAQQEIKLLDLNSSFKLNITPNLNTILTLAEVSNSYRGYNFTPTTLSSINPANGGNGRNTGGQSLDEGDQKSLEWIGNYTLTAQRNSFNILGGYSYQYFTNSGFNASNEDFPSDLLTWNNLGTGLWNLQPGVNNTGSYKNTSKLIAFFARVNYDFDKRYYLSASLRKEGSSKFGQDNKWGLFPAVSVAWRMSQENFLKGSSWINDLKLRADYGETGNQDFSNYLSLLTYSGAGYYLFDNQSLQVIGPSQTPNPFLGWEKAKNFNVGVDFELLQRRVNGSVNYYRRTNENLLGSYPVPVPPNLQPTIFANVGTMRNSGFEIQITGDIVRQKDFDYSLTFIGATNQNLFVSFSSSTFKANDFLNVVSMPAPGSPGTIQRLQEGKRIGSFYIKKSAGVDDSGALLVYNSKGDVIRAETSNDDDKQFIGNGLPKFTGSLGNSFRYKNFDLNIFLRGNFGYQIFNTNAFYIGTPSTQANANTLTSAYDGSKYSKLTNPATYSVLSDYFLENGSFVKIDNITLGYNHNLHLNFVQSFRIYGTVRNLHTFTGYTGGDPDLIPVNGLYPGLRTNSSNNGTMDYYPATTQWLLGLQVTF